MAIKDVRREAHGDPRTTIEEHSRDDGEEERGFNLLTLLELGSRELEVLVEELEVLVEFDADVSRRTSLRASQAPELADALEDRHRVLELLGHPDDGAIETSVVEERDRCGLATELEDLHGLLIARLPEPVRGIGDLTLGGLETVDHRRDRAVLDRVNRVAAVLVIEEVIDLADGNVGGLLCFHAYIIPRLIGCCMPQDSSGCSPRIFCFRIAGSLANQASSVGLSSLPPAIENIRGFWMISLYSSSSSAARPFL